MSERMTDRRAAHLYRRLFGLNTERDDALRDWLRARESEAALKAELAEFRKKFSNSHNVVMHDQILAERDALRADNAALTTRYHEEVSVWAERTKRAEEWLTVERADRGKILKEISALKAEVAEAKADRLRNFELSTDLRTKFDALRADNARLRAALKAFCAGCEAGLPVDPDLMHSDGKDCRLPFHARAALKEGGSRG